MLMGCFVCKLRRRLEQALGASLRVALGKGCAQEPTIEAVGIPGLGKVWSGLRRRVGLRWECAFEADVSLDPKTLGPDPGHDEA
jgi:hypothetical protein